MIIIKLYHRILNPWLQTINVSVSSDSKSLLIFDGFLLHLNIDLLKKLGGGWYAGPALHDKHLTRDQRGGSGEFWYRIDIISKCYTKSHDRASRSWYY